MSKEIDQFLTVGHEESETAVLEKTMLSARFALVRYLDEGTSMYLNDYRKYVKFETVRSLLVLAGYPTLGIKTDYFGGGVFLDKENNTPQQSEDNMWFIFEDDNDFGLPKGWYDGTQVVRYVLKTFKPELDEESLLIRRSFILQAAEVHEIEESLRGECLWTFIEADNWHYDNDGKVFKFWVNGPDPIGAGWFTSEEIRQRVSSAISQKSETPKA